MFKYISEIISKISIGQRLAALGIVLFSIVIISIGPSLISGLTQDNDDLIKKVEMQQGEINQLNGRVIELNGLVINNQRECTDRFVDRELEILEMVTRLEGIINVQDRMARQRNQMAAPRGVGVYGGDTVFEMSAPMVMPMVADDMLKNAVKDIKSNIEGCIEKSNGVN